MPDWERRLSPMGIYDSSLLCNQPLSTKDISLFYPDVNNSIWSEIISLIIWNGGEHLKSITLVEYWKPDAPSSHKECEVCKARGIIRAPKVPSGYVGMLIQTKYQHLERTLTNIEVNEVDKKVRCALARAGAILR